MTQTPKLLKTTLHSDMTEKEESETISKAMSILGKRTSEKKSKAARENGKLGGYPKGRKRISQLTENKACKPKG